jgi:uracil-DNA glycosylase
MRIPAGWQSAVGAETEKPYYRELARFIERERAEKCIFPPPEDVFRALLATPFDAVRIVLLGQDPYHDDGQAHGLSFSVRAPTRPPPSLRNMFRELKTDLGTDVAPNAGDLTAWASQGVLLLNTVLTVVAHTPASHKGKGWETFTDAVIDALNARVSPVVFCLWGAHARKKAKAITAPQHAVLESAHPSPLSATKFFGSKPFSKINAALAERGHQPIDWSRVGGHA